MRVLLLLYLSIWVFLGPSTGDSVYSPRFSRIYTFRGLKATEDLIMKQFLLSIVVLLCAVTLTAQAQKRGTRTVRKATTSVTTQKSIGIADLEKIYSMNDFSTTKSVLQACGYTYKTNTSGTYWFTKNCKMDFDTFEATPYGKGASTIICVTLGAYDVRQVQIHIASQKEYNRLIADMTNHGYRVRNSASGWKEYRRVGEKVSATASTIGDVLSYSITLGRDM